MRTHSSTTSAKAADSFRWLEVITGVGRRRRWSLEELAEDRSTVTLPRQSAPPEAKPPGPSAVVVPGGAARVAAPDQRGAVVAETDTGATAGEHLVEAAKEGGRAVTQAAGKVADVALSAVRGGGSGGGSGGDETAAASPAGTRPGVPPKG
jgi:hypothetical protein